ncbi:MAG TPA: YbhB/YbcL family Raf kinase inhibitor-like protein [bacterium]|nr:YbhB/YbcL family Raf kinase inhibitor-like protein [bacterium]
MVINNFVILNLLGLILIGFCFGANDFDAESVSNLQIRCPDFANQAAIPQKYTCQGEELSPPLEWNSGPNATKSYAIIVTDPDAPIPFVTITHWVIYNIPVDQNSLSPGLPEKQQLENGIRQGKRSFGKHSYMGPCPPFGEHRYFFRIYALDKMLDLKPEKASRKKLLKAIEGHVVGFGEMYGVFSK